MSLENVRRTVHSYRFDDRHGQFTVAIPDLNDGERESVFETAVVSDDYQAMP
ncbi:MAG TPA: hypothetical protein VNQ14_16510 [Woeseiaceae bacterium]|nr:hypothetical protein [Woeseiaceae bacterium]